MLLPNLGLIAPIANGAHFVFNTPAVKKIEMYEGLIITSPSAVKINIVRINAITLNFVRQTVLAPHE